VTVPPPEAFFLPLAPGRWQPTEATVGPWARDLQHGGPPIALLARAMRLHPGGADLAIARLTVEFLGPVPLAPCQIAVRVLRPGRRIELLEADLSVDGKAVLLARAWRLERLPGSSPPVPDPFVVPAIPDVETTEFFPGVTYFPYGRAIEWRFVHGSFVRPGPALVWGRPRIALVPGEETAGLEGLLVLLDSATGVSAELDIRTHTFVPVDLSLNLHRMPTGPWFGMDARTIVDGAGVGAVSTTVFDATGPVGRSLHTLFVRPR
jgi:acyl-coenzyme A thioesterase PaaI-like protein